MKLSWKLFFITTPIFIIFLTVFGSWMIQGQFQNSLDQEMNQCMVENQMFQNSFELTWNSLSQEQKEQTSIRRLVDSFHRKSGRESSARVLDGEGAVLYQDGGTVITHDIIERMDDSHNMGYGIFQEAGKMYAVVVGRTSFDTYIETTKDISAVFDSRSDMYSTYQTGMLMLSVLVGCVIWLIMFFVMRNLQKLSGATRQFARGKYDVRVHIRSGDEIGMLADDFNWMANEMNLQMERLQDEVKRQEEFTAAFAHELKTPLTSIIGYADTIRQMELSPEETDMCADYIYRQGKRLQSLSYKLLEMTMAGKQEIAWKEIHVPSLLQEVKKTVETVFSEHQITLQAEAREGVIYGDRDLLGSLFINLADNARKASEPGQTVTLVGEPVSGGYLIRVSDNGKGIPKEELSRITEAFYMVDKSRSRKEGGAGLGLALCRKIIDLHQGGWQIESEPGRGTTVSVLFGTPAHAGRERRRSRRAKQRKENAG